MVQDTGKTCVLFYLVMLFLVGDVYTRWYYVQHEENLTVLNKLVSYRFIFQTFPRCSSQNPSGQRTRSDVSSSLRSRKLLP